MGAVAIDIGACIGMDAMALPVEPKTNPKTATKASRAIGSLNLRGTLKRHFNMRSLRANIDSLYAAFLDQTFKNVILYQRAVDLHRVKHQAAGVKGLILHRG